MTRAALTGGHDGPRASHGSHSTDVRPSGSQSPSITVGVPVRNGEPYLDRALTSLLEQTAADFEILIGDNCSTDGTEQICRRIQQQDPRVRYVRRETNVGVQTNHNLLVKAARGDYFLWAAHDDESAPGRLSRLREALAGSPGAVAAVSAVQEIDEHGRPLHVWQDECRTDGPDPARRLHDYLAYNRTTLHVYGLFRRDVLLLTGLLAPTHQGDRVLIAEMLLNGPFVTVPEPLLRHRLHDGRISVRKDPRTIARQELEHQHGPRAELPNVDELLRYLGVLRRAPLSRRDRMRAAVAFRPWIRENTVPMARNIARAVVEIVGRTSRPTPGRSGG